MGLRAYVHMFLEYADTPFRRYADTLCASRSVSVLECLGAWVLVGRVSDPQYNAFVLRCIRAYVLRKRWFATIPIHLMVGRVGQVRQVRQVGQSKQGGLSGQNGRHGLARITGYGIRIPDHGEHENFPVPSLIRGKYWKTGESVAGDGHPPAR